MSAGMLEFGSWWLSFGSRTLIPGTRKKSGLSSDTIESVIVVETRGEVGADKNRSLIAIVMDWIGAVSSMVVQTQEEVGAIRTVVL